MPEDPHIYHAGNRPAQFVVATIGTYEENCEFVVDEFAVYGYFFVAGE